MEENDKNELKQAVLCPDHPLLEKFQQALKEHYLSQIARLKENIFEYETEAKKKNDEREQLGIQAYEAQQMVCKQQTELEGIIENLQNTTAAREEVETSLKELKSQHKELREQLISSEKNCFQLLNEINSVGILCAQMTELEEKLESSITVNQRVAEKIRKDNLRLIKEQIEQTAHIHQTKETLYHMENEIEAMNIQIQIKEAEKEELAETLTIGNTNLEALQAEYRCLMHSWNSVVVAISNRDKILDCLKSQENNIGEKIKNTISEIEQVKKLTKKEMMENEKLTMFKSRFENDISNLKQQIEEEMVKNNAIQMKLGELQVISDRAETDFQRVSTELRHKEIVLRGVAKRIDRISTEKYTLEQIIQEDLENQVAKDKVALNFVRMLKSISEKKAEVEIKLNETENRHSALKAEVESQKFHNGESKLLLEDAENQQNELEREANAVDAEKKKANLLLQKREQQVKILTNRLECFTDRYGKETISPQELKSISLEKQIEETKEKIQYLQAFWLREQRYLLTVSKERQEQIHQLNLLKKQTLILEQKNIQVTGEIQAYRKQEERLEYVIRTLQSKSIAMCDHLFKKKDKKSDLNKSNYFLQTQYEGKLKECEMECLNLLAEIEEIEDDKVTMSQELIELNREALEWESKIKLVTETKQNLKKERSEDGEITNMRQEIQRMNVIYYQLRKAQDRLMKDLEMCVTRRDAIFTIAEARQKKSTEDKTRVNYARKMDDLRNSIKQCEEQKKQVNEKISVLEKEKKQISAKVAQINRDVNFYTKYKDTLEDDLEKAKTNRQLKFELLLLTQKKKNLYNDLTLGRTPYVVYKNENQLVSEYNKQKEANNKLCGIIEKLISNCPNHSEEFTRLYNTLKLHIYGVIVNNT